MDAVLQGEEIRRPAPLRAPGNRSRLILFRSRGDYGCVWTTCAKRTDAPVVFSVTRITGWEVAATKRGPQRGCSAGGPAFGAATSCPVIRVNLYATGASVRLAHVVHTHP